MDIVHALVLGIIQGITEFLPISSTGHLILVPYLLGWDIESLSFDAVLHLGTLLAVLVYFRRDWVKIIGSLLQDLVKGVRQFSHFRFESRLGILIIFGSIPAGIIGILLENIIETTLRSPLIVAASLIVIALLMYWVDTKAQVLKPLKNFKPLQAIGVGFAQAIALIPGVSRSGITISAGMLAGLEREEAARFSFLLATPVVLGAGLMSLYSVFTGGGVEPLSTSLLVGVLSSAVTGFLAIKFLLNFLKSQKLTVFIIYRIALAMLIIAVTLLY